MFVQQMHFYNTLIEDISRGEESKGDSGSSNTPASFQIDKIDTKMPNIVKQGNTPDVPENDGHPIPCDVKNYNEAVDKLRTYECRALNLFRYKY